MYSIYFLIAIAIFLALVIFLGFFTKTVISKRAIWYSVPLIIYMFLIYYVGYTYAGEPVNGLVLFNCLVYALKSFTFEINSGYVSSLVSVYSVYALSLYLGVICCGLTLVFGAFELVKAAFHNDFYRTLRLLGKKADFVLGYNEDAFKYCKSNKDTILWIDPTVVKLKKEDKMKLYDDNIIYIYAPFNAKRLKRNSLLVFKNIFVICFQDNNQYFSSILKTLEELKPFKKKIIEFHVQAKSDNLSFVNEQLTRRCLNKDNVMASSFDYYELMSRKFSFDHNLAKYLPKGFIEEGVVTKGRNINVVMLGFGKTSKAILKSILINNQFVEISDENKYRCKKINIEIYDKSEESFEDPLITHIKHFEKLCAKGYFNFDPKLGPLELSAEIIETKKSNVKSDVSDEFIASLIRDENDFTYYVVALSDSVDNSMIAEMLSKTVSQSSSVIFYNIDDNNERLLTDSTNCYPFGFKNEILSHDNITAEDLCTLAKANNETYNKKSGKNNDFYAIPIIEKLSNIYKEINLRFKLNLVGLDYTFDKSVKGLEKVEYEKKYNAKKYHKDIDYYIEMFGIKNAAEEKYNDYFELNLGNALIYQEHLRWAMYYFLYDYKGMKLEDIKLVNGKIVHKDIPNRKHACITSFEGADKLHRYELQMYLDNNITKSISNVETFQYDMKLDTAYEELTQLGYKVIELK